MRLILRSGAIAVSVAGALPVIAGAAVASGSQLTSAEISELVPGSTVNIDTPLDVPLPLRFNPDGTVTGTAGKLEFYLKSQTDKGRWWVADNKLCQKWRRWFDAKVTCLSLTRTGEKFAWEREDGTKGTASVVGRPPSATAVASAEEKSPTLVEKVAAALTPAPPGPRGLGGPDGAAMDPTPSAAAAASRPTSGQAELPPPVRAARPVPARRPSVAAAPRRAAPPVRIAAAQVVPPPAPADVRSSGGILYRVVNVAQNDTLNIRSEPGTHGRIVATVRPDAHGIILTGSCNGYWCPVLHGSSTGWVNRYYLSLQPMLVQASR